MGTTDRNAVLETLTAGIEALTTSEAWQAHLVVQGRFHRYSFSNALLICAQDPEATRVAGFATWKRLERSVRKGERAIWILAPMTGRRARAGDGEEHRPIVGFRPVPVFDVAQTDGEPLPVVCRNLHGGDPDLGLRPAGGACRWLSAIWSVDRTARRHQWRLLPSPSGGSGSSAATTLPSR